MIRIGFFGTPELSRRVLEDFLRRPEFEVAFVVTGEDKPVGRHQVLTVNPVKELALEHNLPVLQPVRIRGNTELLETIASYGADYFVVVAYGKILPKELLSIPKKYPINIHGSILPKYRGASPIQSALIAGDRETGVTIIVMSEGMDEGDIVDVKMIEIDAHETTQTLFEKFAEVSGTFAAETILRLDRGEISPQQQNETEATYCKKITKEEGLLDFSRSAEELYHLYQGLTPWPGVYTVYKGKKLIVEECFYDLYSDFPSPSPMPSSPTYSPHPNLLLGGEEAQIGTVIRVGDTVGIVCDK